MKLTAHFDSREFDQLARHSQPFLAYPERWLATRLRVLCEQLEVLRETLGKPVTILSGFRSEEYNRQIGGARLSQHVQGRAADIIVQGVSAAAAHSTMLDLYRAGKVVIGGLGIYPRFVHVDVREGPRLARWEGSRRES